MTGRKPIPTALKRLSGDGIRDSGGRIIPDEPHTTPEAPDAPDDLTKEAYAEWDRVTGELGSMGVLATVDRAALWLYIENWQIKADAWKGHQSTKLIIKGANGLPQANPWLKHYRDAAKFEREMLVEFGLTPSSRSRLKVTPQDDDNGDEFGELEVRGR